MRTILFTLSFFVSLCVNAQDNKIKIDELFGSSYTQASQIIETQFGKPESTNRNNIVYKNKIYKGLKFDLIEFNFTDDEDKSYLSEARFFIMSPNKIKAKQQLQSLVKSFEKDFSLSHDIEDDGTDFYKGGLSPNNNDFLFTLYTYKKNNKYTTELRYGPFYNMN